MTERINESEAANPDAEGARRTHAGQTEPQSLPPRPILRRLFKPFRYAGTAIAFGFFGASGMLFRFGITPWLNLTEKDEEKRIRIARRIVWRWFRLFVAGIRDAGLVRVEVRHAERLSRPGLIVAANHPSLIDVVCLISLIPEATTIVKASLAKNWFTAPPIRAAGYATNDLGPEALGRLEADLKRGAVFVVFPEGTRTPVDLPPGVVPRMHRGAAALALHTGRPVTPVRISAAPRWLTKDRGWWHMPDEPMTLTFEVLEDIPVDDLRPLYNERPSIGARRLNKRLAAALFPVEHD